MMESLLVSQGALLPVDKVTGLGFGGLGLGIANLLSYFHYLLCLRLVGYQYTAYKFEATLD
jgi:hypothetical protein